MRAQHWQDIVSLTLGLWLVLSPLVLNFRGVPAGLTVILGIFVCLLAVEALILPSYLEEIGEIAVGIALLLSPIATGYADSVPGYNSMLIALLVIVCAVSEITTDGEFLAWWKSRRSGVKDTAG